MNKTTAKKYLSAIESSKRKFITCEVLSRSMGIYPEIIAENLSYFEPMLAMDPSFDLKELVPAIEQYIEEEENKKVLQSPLNSESFGGYSYSKGSSSKKDGSQGQITWRDVFGDELKAYRKIG